MIEQPSSFDDRIESLLRDAQYLDHPLRKALAQLWAQDRERLERLERISLIADGYHRIAIDGAKSINQRYNQHLRRLEKAVRISDGYQQMMRELCAKLEAAAHTDQLTGLANRRLAFKRLGEEAKRTNRHHQPLALALLDIDHFKRVNDRFGHYTGDEVLVSFAQAIRNGLREYDLCARWGGEEFLILLPNTAAAAAVAVLHRLQEHIRALPLAPKGQTLSMTASIGIAMYRAGEDISDTISRADDALIAAKRRGRDCCVSA